MADRGRNNDLAQLVSDRIRWALLDTHTATVGRVVAFDSARQTATIQIEIFRQFEDEAGETEDVPVPPLLDVPVLFPRAGGYAITFPVAVGDPCLVVFGERDLGGWRLQGSGAVPPTARIHDYSDAVAILGLFDSQRALAPAPSASALQIRNDLSTKRIEISPTGVSVVSDGAISAQAAGDASIVSAQDVDITAALQITALANLALNLIGVASALLASTGPISINAGAALSVNSVGPIAITRGPNELLLVLSDALDEIGTSTAGGDALSNAAAIAALKAKIDAMRT